MCGGDWCCRRGISQRLIRGRRIFQRDVVLVGVVALVADQVVLEVSFAGGGTAAVYWTVW